MHRSMWYRLKKHFKKHFNPDPPAVFSVIFTKKRALSQMSDSVETFVLGSSHGNYGFHATGNEFNFCIDSQDLYSGYEIYKKYADLKNLKTIILFYSVFSPGFDLEMTNIFLDPIAYKILLDIPYRYERNDRKKTEKTFQKYMRSDKICYDHTDSRGNFDHCSFFGKNIDAKERADGHLKNAVRENGQTKYVAEMQNLAEKNGHSFVVVIPPARSDYMQHMPPCETVFKDLFSLKNVRTLNYFGSSDFSDEDFGDMDHLNLQGALKLTDFIHKALNNK